MHISYFTVKTIRFFRIVDLVNNREFKKCVFNN